MSSDSYPVPLSAVLKPPFQLAYAIPLLILSVPLTFAGAFLTLDRTRSFVPQSNSEKAQDKKWRFEGGVGGLLGGFLFGVHLSTLLALLIMNRTNVKELSSVIFMVIWVLSAISLAILAVRFRIAALLFIGLGGGIAFSLFIVIISHPSHLARSILLAVFSVISAVLCLLPIPNLQHGIVRASTAWLGAFGIIISISILARYSSWADVWARLWVNWRDGWGTSQEKGLSAALAGLVALGSASDYLLRRQFGECPDEKWDNYLANYASSLPSSDRAGEFRPNKPFWQKIFEKDVKQPIAFPPDKALLSSPYKKDGGARLTSRPVSTSFKPLNPKGGGLSSDSDSDDEDGRYIPRPWAPKRKTTSLSGVTLAGSDPKDKGKAKSLEIDYSDGESASTSKRPLKEGGGNYKALGRSESPPPGAVPITPSLLNALERVGKAQSAAYANANAPSTPGALTTPGAEAGWNGFWRNVEDKVKEGESQRR